MRSLKQFSIALVVALLMSGAAIAQQVPVNQEIQQQTNWCWSACSKCVLDYYGAPPQTQCSIAEYARSVITWSNFGSSNCCVDPSQGCNQWNYSWAYSGSIEDILLHFGNIVTLNHSNPLSMQEVQVETNYANPFIIRWGWYGGGGHFMIGAGVSGNDIYYMNPLPGYGSQIGNYNWVVDDNTDHQWTHSMTFCPPPPATLTGVATACQGDALTFSIAPQPDATYSWSLPTGWNGTSTSSTISALAGAANGSVVLNYTDRCSRPFTLSQWVVLKTVNAAVTKTNFTLTANQTQAQYQWVKCPSMQAVTNATAQVFKPTQSGSYAVQVTKDGCEAVSSCYSVSIIDGLSSLSSADFMSDVFPVPANGQIHVKAEGVTPGACTLKLTNALGQCVGSHEVVTGSSSLAYSLDISELPIGVYYLTIAAQNGNALHKVIIDQQ